MKNKLAIRVIIAVITIILIILCATGLLDYMITYKYHIEQNFDHSDLVVSFKERKNEIELITVYLKIFIVYLLALLGYFIYEIFSKNK